ncbi:hypothetical protein PPACK8108_LOCUS9360 [Phakopsora pachyrhizi]|uniref:Uncharacterized protein n=1 Tax=Phakopsora pachyrhizi TaxID=170000 RepID=A0AAV0AYE3_PHAPC|nr:hypothetical protein PPACK8108_LOCUS9360 [Phakopsora pachyrhizi]
MVDWVVRLGQEVLENCDVNIGDGTVGREGEKRRRLLDERCNHLEPIQVFATNSNTSITFEAPDRCLLQNLKIILDDQKLKLIEIEIEQVCKVLTNLWDTFNSFLKKLQKALKLKNLELVKKIEVARGLLEFKEAEKVIGNLDQRSGIRQFSDSIENELAKTTNLRTRWLKLLAKVIGGLRDSNYALEDIIGISYTTHRRYGCVANGSRRAAQSTAERRSGLALAQSGDWSTTDKRIEEQRIEDREDIGLQEKRSREVKQERGAENKVTNKGQEFSFHKISRIIFNILKINNNINKKKKINKRKKKKEKERGNNNNIKEQQQPTILRTVS